ncbi:hypothetical protein SDC9_143674 [bioreactor metagenome]|uniref:Uncharacterized protein n=1 Tax=bioreactor metagenome TaxID=1076179 RepID=A0A645E421_9ZZZZ
MVSADQLPKRYVTLTGDDVIEVVEVQKSGGFGVLLSAFGKLISESVE